MTCGLVCRKVLTCCLVCRKVLRIALFESQGEWQGRTKPESTRYTTHISATCIAMLDRAILSSNGLFHFLPIQGYGREIPRDCARNTFQGSQGLKLSFQGVMASFPEGSYKIGQAFQWDHTWKIVFLWAIFGITLLEFQPKGKFRKLPSIPLYGLKME